MVTTDVSEESDRGNSGSSSDGKLCLRMKLITPVNEENESAPQFSLESKNTKRYNLKGTIPNAELNVVMQVECSIWCYVIHVLG